MGPCECWQLTITADTKRNRIVPVFSLAHARVRCSSWVEKEDKKGSKKRVVKSSNPGQFLPWQDHCSLRSSAGLSLAPQELPAAIFPVFMRGKVMHKQGFYATPQHHHQPGGGRDGEQFWVPVFSPQQYRHCCAPVRPLTHLAHFLQPYMSFALEKKLPLRADLDIPVQSRGWPWLDWSSSKSVLLLPQGAFTCMRAPPQPSLLNPYSGVQDRNHPSCRDGEQPQLFPT